MGNTKRRKSQSKTKTQDRIDLPPLAESFIFPFSSNVYHPKNVAVQFHASVNCRSVSRSFLSHQDHASTSTTRMFVSLHYFTAVANKNNARQSEPAV